MAASASPEGSRKTLAKDVPVSMAVNRNTLCCASSRTRVRSRVSMLRMLWKERGLGPPTTLWGAGGFCAAQMVQPEEARVRPPRPSNVGGTLHRPDAVVLHEGGLSTREPYEHLRTCAGPQATVVHEVALLLEVGRCLKLYLQIWK